MFVCLTPYQSGQKVEIEPQKSESIRQCCCFLHPKEKTLGSSHTRLYSLLPLSRDVGYGPTQLPMNLRTSKDLRRWIWFLGIWVAGCTTGFGTPSNKEIGRAHV